MLKNYIYIGAILSKTLATGILTVRSPRKRKKKPWKMFVDGKMIVFAALYSNALSGPRGFSERHRHHRVNTI